jgi:hypothetical protein
VAKELPVAKPIDPVEILEQIFQARNQAHEVTISLEKRKVRISKDPLRFSIHSSKPGYVYLLMVGTDRTQFWLLFPNALDKKNTINADKPLDLPRSNWRMDATGPPGTDQFIAIVSDSPRDFSDAGMKPQGPFSEFPLNTIIHSKQETRRTVPVFAGKAKCANGQSENCPESYGAAVFSIEEISTR